jgi:hypothetical protein
LKDVGLLGERGRERRTFVDDDLGPNLRLFLAARNMRYVLSTSTLRSDSECHSFNVLGLMEDWN